MYIYVCVSIHIFECIRISTHIAKQSETKGERETETETNRYEYTE